MKVALHLIWGATSTGKTSAAVALAEKTGAPVISLDRVQCCPEVATGSGRPTLTELRGTRRVYLFTRSLKEGVPTASEANFQLKKTVAHYASRHDLLILEGGSISLLNTMMDDPHWSRFHWSSRKFQLNDEAAFLRNAQARVQQMIEGGDGLVSLLDELAVAWPDAGAREVISDIDGYRYAIQFANELGVLPTELRNQDAATKQRLAAGIAAEYLDHARWQSREFRDVPSSWLSQPGWQQLDEVA